MRWIRRLGILVIVLVVGLWLTIFLGSRSAKVRAMVAGKIANTLGAPASIGSVRVGWSDIAAGEVKLGDLATGGYEVEVGKFAGGFGGSGWLLGGTTPRSVDVSDVKITLDLDKLKQKSDKPGKKFDLKESLESLPRSLKLDRGTIVLKSAGRSDAVFDNVSLQGNVDAAGLLAEGAIDSPTWKKWALKFDTREASESQAAVFTMTTAGPTRVTQEMLESLNFLPASAFSSIKLNGDVEGFITAKFSKALDPTPDIDLKVTKADLFINAASLKMEDVAGTMLVQGETLSLKGMDAKVVGSPAKADGTISWAGDDTALRFKVETDPLGFGQIAQGVQNPGNDQGQIFGQGHDLGRHPFGRRHQMVDGHQRHDGRLRLERFQVRLAKGRRHAHQRRTGL